MSNSKNVTLTNYQLTLNSCAYARKETLFFSNAYIKYKKNNIYNFDTERQIICILRFVKLKSKLFKDKE